MGLAVETIVISKPIFEAELAKLKEEWEDIKPSYLDDDYTEQQRLKAHKYGRIKALEWVLSLNLRK